MLHILWLITKWILIILGVILCIFFLTVFLLLFCPVRYRMKAYKPEEGGKETIEACGSVSWLFRGIGFYVFYEHGKIKTVLRILGISLGKSRHKKKKNRKDLQKELPKKQEEYLKECEKTCSNIRIEEQKEEKEQKSLKKEVPEVEKKKSGLLKGFVGKIKSIPYKIRKIRLTIKRTCVKIEWWKTFFSNTRVREGISVFWKDVKKLLHHIFPVKVEGNIRFGCEDPSVTGKITALLGICMPFSKKCIQITPIFQTDQNILAGNIKMKGRIYGVVLLRIAMRIFFDKDIKYVINQWKRKEV